MKCLDFLEDLFLVLALMAIGLILLVQIVFRYALNHPLIWSEELARFIFVWMAFVGASYGVKNRTHISMALLYNMVPRRVKLPIRIFNNILAISAFLVIVIAGWDFVLDQMVMRSSAMGISMSWFFAALPFGCLLMSLRLALDTIGIVRQQGAET